MKCRGLAGTAGPLSLLKGGIDVPSNWLYVDTQFPQFTDESPDEKITIIQNYMFMLVEQMRYTLHNLDSSNMNTTAREKFVNEITEPFSVLIAEGEEKINSIQVNVDGVSAKVSEVENGLETVSTKHSVLEQRVNSIKLSVTNGTTSSTIKLMAGEAEISSQNISMSGLVTFTGLADGTTTIDGACIKTGTILSDRIKLGGDLTIYETLDSDVRAGRLGKWNATIDDVPLTVFGFASDTNGFIGGEERMIVAGDRVDIYGNFYINGNQYINLSDRRLKKNIDYGASDKLTALCDMLQPVTFEMIGDDHPGRGYIGFIAQDIQAAAELLGIGDALVEANNKGMLILNHGPLTAALAAKIHQIDMRLYKLEGRS